MDLHSEEQVEKALKKNKDYIGEKSHRHWFILHPDFRLHSDSRFRTRVFYFGVLTLRAL